LATRETQAKILQVALQLFNERGTGAVSTNRVAAVCGVSRGNLHYHFRCKDEIIEALFEQALAEMKQNWSADLLEPSLERLARMFVHTLQLVVRYRFFYREMAQLFRRNARLRVRYAESRVCRVQELDRFLVLLSRRGLMCFPEDRRRRLSIIDATWILTENWLNYLDFHDRPVTTESVLSGYYEILEVLRPYLCSEPQQLTSE